MKLLMALVSSYKMMSRLSNMFTFLKLTREAYFTDDVMQNLEAIIDRSKNENKEVVFTEYTSNMT